MTLPGTDAPKTDGATRLGELVSGRYRIQKLLGEGGMGAVYLAEHTAMRKRVALKLLHKEVSGNAEVIARFEREGIASAKIEHPNVASATDFGKTEDGSLFLVLEYLDGVSLRDVVAAGAIPWTRALHIARQIALALDRAHSAGIVHRDLKPENVMLVTKGADSDFVKVLDFGIAKMSAQVIPEGADRSQPLTRMGTVLGTPEYMAPEQALGEAVTPAADLYGLGVMMYEMIAGRHMFDPPDRMAMLSFHLVAPVPPIGDHAPGIEVPALVEAVVRRLLEKDSKARYPSARALIEAIDAAAAASGLDVQGSSLPAGGLAALAPPSAPGARDSWKNSDSYAQTSVGLPSPTKTTFSGARPGILETIGKLPRPALYGLAAAVPLGLILLVVAIVLATRAPSGGVVGSVASGDAPGSAKTADAPKVKRAPEDRVKAAEASGPDALAALAKEFPNDPDLTKRIALADAAQSRFPDSMRAVHTLLELSPKEAADPEVVATVTSAATAPPGDAADDAFAILEGPLGEKGVDALIEIGGRPHTYGRRGAKPPFDPAARALKSLADPSVRAHASPAAGILLDMKAAKGCAAKRELLERAKEQADARLLFLLRALRTRRGCGFAGFSDCWPCMHGDDALDETIQAVEARSK